MTREYEKYLNLYTKDDWQNVGRRCKVCGGQDNRCSETEDGAWGVCYKPDSKAISYKDGVLGHYGTYVLDPQALEAKILESESAVSITKILKEQNKGKELTDSEEKFLDEIHRYLISSWDLSPEHRRYLHNRGFSDIQIEKQLYRTSANSNQIIHPLVKKHSSNLLNVPGFLQVLGEYQFRSHNELIIPTINARGRIINFRKRDILAHTTSKKKYFYVSSRNSRDPNDKGLKAIASAHVLIPSICTDKRVWITEGEFKAHIASDLVSAVFISIPGVGLWSLAIPALEYLNVQKVVLAFDMDLYNNPHVAKSLVKLFNNLKELGYEVQIAKW